VDYIHCAQCDYLDTQEFARRSKNALSAEDARELEKVATPDAHTIEALATLLNIPKEKTAKAVFMTATIDDKEKLIFAILRGDMDLSEEKLVSAIGASDLRPQRMLKF
jgi:prolyl-tRNA synthetase